MNAAASVAGRFFGVVARPRTYGNLAYLLLAFPLALFYTVFFAVGYSLGFGLLVVLVGAPILVGMVLATVVAVAVERELAVHLLGLDGATGLSTDDGDGVFDTLLAWLGNGAFWRGLALLAVKSALGVVAFTLVVTLLASSLALLFAPLAQYDAAVVGVQVGGWRLVDGGTTVRVGAWTVDTMAEAVVASGVGLLLTVASLHVINAAARAFGYLAAWLLDAELADA